MGSLPQSTCARKQEIEGETGNNSGVSRGIGYPTGSSLRMRSLLQNSQQWQCDVSTRATPEKVSSIGSTSGLRRLNTRARAFAVRSARELTMSNRRAWQQLASMYLGFDQAVATASTGGRRGGGTEVTEFGTQLVAGNRRMESKVQSLAVAQLREVSQHVQGGRPRFPSRSITTKTRSSPHS
jgi:molybdate transport repressor ModE-like protein